jgi:5-methylcytosine-specific restriction protein B
MNQNNKEKFELWLSNNMTENSGANSSYLRSLSLLEESYYKEGKIKTKSIFDVNDVSKIKELYKEAIEIQRDKNSYIYRKEAPSYGDKGFFSASLKKYIDFLSDGSSLIKIRPDVKHYSFDFKTFHHFSKESSLNFSKILVLRFIASLTSKPFVILGGKNNSNGTALIKDADGNILIRLDRDGITLSEDVQISYENISDAPSIPTKVSNNERIKYDKRSSNGCSTSKCG